MPPLSDTHRLWVPMQVQALVFGEPGTAQFVDLTPTYENLLDPQEAPLGAKLRPLLDADPSPPFLEKGIHLHWALPAAFTHVRPATDGNGSTLPLAPNRWLVMRLWETARGTLSQRSWIIESDFTDPDEGAAPWLDERNGRVEITRLGRKVALADWTEHGKASGSLTAFAPGNLGFAAFYPSCRGVFGFHDEADDLPDRTVCTYLVAGWFSRTASDPLSVGTAPKPEELWSERMLQHRWAIPDDSASRPTAVTCYGIAPGIEWTPDTPCSTGQLPGVRIALGRSIIEALAALAKANGTEADRDRLVSELQLAALAERRPTLRDMEDPAFFKTLGRLLGARAKLHEQAFSALDGGASWEIVSPEKEKKQGSEDANAQATPQLPPDVAAQLADLNRAQCEFDEAMRGIDAGRRRLFAAWYRHQFWSTNAMGGASAEQIAVMLADLEADTAEVDAKLVELKARQDRRDAAERGLRDRTQPKSPDDVAEFELVARAMPRFWQASDPFVLTAGLPVPALQGGASLLQCRVSDQTIAGITITDVPTYGTITVTRADLTKLLAQQGFPPAARDGLPPDIAELMLEAVFTDRQRAEVLARAYWRDRNQNPSDRQIEEVRRAIDTAQKTIEAAVATVNSGPSAVDPKTLPLTGLDGLALRSLLSVIRLPSTPSRPVFMVWRANWYPHRPDAGQPASDPWDITDDIDCRWKDAPPQRGGKPGIIEGFAPIATGLERGLAASRETFPEPEYQFVFERLTQLAGQSLSGLTDALATRASGPQVRPLTRAGTGELHVDPIAALIDHQYAAAPAPGGNDGPPFSPVRGGHFTLSRLWIVDGFGRIQRLIDTESEEPARNAPILSHTLAGPEPAAAHLLPRLVQPARLQLRWLSARNDKQESLGNLGTSPICGFVVHNRLDRSLLIYGAGDASETSVGTLLGTVQAISLPQGKEAVRWSKMPVRPFDTDGAGGLGPGEADIPNAHLRNFVNGLLARTGGAGAVFAAFRRLLERHEDSADLSLDQGLQSVLVGRPLALIRASLRLELDGPPVTDQSVQRALAADRQTQEPWFRNLKIPVRIGDRRLGPDGLVGYFVGDGSAAAYETLCLRSDETSDPGFEGNAYFGAPTLEVSCDPQAGPLILTLLLDPKRGVNVISGILPAFVSTLPQALLAEAVSDLEIPFLVAPVLGERTGEQGPEAIRRMPLPTNGHGEWSWAFFPDAKAPSREAPVSGDTAAAPSLSTSMALHEGWLKYRPAKGEKR